jgi:hypothetical protein
MKIVKLIDKYHKQHPSNHKKVKRRYKLREDFSFRTDKYREKLSKSFEIRPTLNR